MQNYIGIYVSLRQSEAQSYPRLDNGDKSS